MALITTDFVRNLQDVMECKTIIVDHLANAAAGTSLGDHVASCHTGAQLNN